MAKPNVMKDGFSTLVYIGGAVYELLEEREVTPVGFTDRGVIDTTGMRNQSYKTFWPKFLAEMSPVTMVMMWAGGAAISEIYDTLNINQDISIVFPDGYGSISFQGAVTGAVPGVHQEGNQPTITVTIHPTMSDDNGAEDGPAYT